jgi:GT2 family glycosyltransferase
VDTPTVDIVIVNWNAGRYLSECIRSLEAIEQRGYRIMRVIIVDNASTDGSANVDAPALPLEIVRNECNVGFGAACNIGARRGDAELILFLNPDTRVDDNSIAACVKAVAHRDDVWVAGAALIDDSGRVQRSCARAANGPRMIAHALGIDRVWPSLGYVMAEWPHDQTRLVDHVIGAFYLIRRAAFERLQGFDERFFVYLEDLDLSTRVRSAGGNCLFVREAEAFHVGGGTTRSIKATRLFYSVRSRLQFAAKHLGAVSTAAVWASSLTVEPLLRTLVALGHGSTREVAEVWRAYGQLLRWIATGTRVR